MTLQPFDLGAMLSTGLGLRRQMQDAGDMPAAAAAVARYFYQGLVDAAGMRECVMVRFYRTQAFGEMDPALQEFARARLDGREPADEMKCLVLLGSAGDEPEWNDPARSRGHRAIPLPSVRIVEQAPMIAQLIREMGLDLELVVAPRPELVQGREGKTYNVFFVPEALDSPYIPAQDGFVRRYGVRSVLGFGGLLPRGDLYATILFARVPIAQESADRFRNIALDLKLAIARFDGRTDGAAPATAAPASIIIQD